MSEVDLSDWVKNASGHLEQKIAVHILLHAIGSSDDLRTTMIMKGGNLLGIRHKSKRYTKDVDFSTATKFKDFDESSFTQEMNDSLISASGDLGYTLRCWVQKTVIEPNPEGTFPTLKINIGYADQISTKDKKFIDKGISPKVLKIDYSFNEETYNSEVIVVSEEGSILAYSILDIMAEKIRSVLQQVVRNRSREQDIYDLNYLITNNEFSNDERFKILDSLKKKSVGKGVDGYLNANGLDDQEITERSRKNYPLLRDTVIDLPDFDTSYNRVNLFYKSLPWSLA
jgi:predicted nucleotidyltransferase component of viral defense system